MLVEIKCEYQKQPKNEYINMTNVGNGEVTRIKSPNETWKSSFMVDVEEKTKADELIQKVKLHMEETQGAIKGTVVIKKLIKMQVVKL